MVTHGLPCCAPKSVLPLGSRVIWFDESDAEFAPGCSVSAAALADSGLTLLVVPAKVRITFPVHPAYEIHIEDPAMQLYLQHWTYITGPDQQGNLAARRAIRQCLRRRESWTGPAPVTLLSPEQTLLRPEEIERLRAFFRELRYDPARQERLIRRFGWHANLVDRSIDNVLDIGCGDGMELLFLRAVLPQAKITAVDFVDRLTTTVRRLTDVNLIVGDVNANCRALPSGFQLIYSNHTLEHVYTPDALLRTLFGMLAPGGSLISVLPMDADPNAVFQDKLTKIAESGASIHPLDMVYLNAAHPWKTNPADLHRTLSGAGYDRVMLYQRNQTRSAQARAAAAKRLERVLCALSFGAFRAVARPLLPEQARITTQISRVLHAAERRVWFGTGKLRTRYAQEILFHAVKPG